ncbi:MAG: right-handed parallel beta-helix repeat-containing protein [Chloroflexi bacterium]|nr:right-handed parallel beta-helix repeat-containing protein [Chloroflexota bacterium]
MFRVPRGRSVRAMIILACIMGMLLALVGLGRANAGGTEIPRGTPITACPYVISMPGEYYLAANLIDCAGTAITISASNVRLMMMGFQVHRASGNGIHVRNASKVSIEGPGLVESAVYGIVLDNADVSAVKGVRARSNMRGIVVERGSDGNQIMFNEMMDNRTDGLSLTASTNNKVRNNAISRNRLYGVIVRSTAPRNVLDRNEAQGNGFQDLYDEGAPRCVSTWSSNDFGTDNETGAGAGPTGGCIR